MDKIEKQRILIVDDKDDMISRLTKTLQDAGYSVSCAQCGKEALEKVERYEYDLVLLDVRLEKPDTGFEVCKKIKQDDTLKEIPVILMSVYGDVYFDVKRVFEVGAGDYICKRTDDQSELLARVGTHLRMRKLCRQMKWKDKRIKEMEEEIKSLRSEL